MALLLSNFNIEDAYLIQKVYDKLLEKLSLSNEFHIDLSLTNDDEIVDLNSKFRNLEKTTDVLSFCNTNFSYIKGDKIENYPDDINPEDGSLILGEIYINKNQAKKQAKEYEHPFERELAFLFLHGVLHLLGYDHENNPGDEMFNLQDEILLSLNLTRECKLVGEVGIFGKTNAGKSTLLNQIIKEKVSIVSWHKQTTRENTIGILNTKQSQIIFTDTPGMHNSKNRLSTYMRKEIKKAINNVDVAIYLIQANKLVSHEEVRTIADYARGSKKFILAISKCDMIEKNKIFPIIEKFKDVENIEAIVPISSTKEKNIDKLTQIIESNLDFGYPIYPTDYYTDKSVRFLVSEIIREKAYNSLKDEIPYGLSVYIEKFNEEEKIVKINALLICEKKSHKSIIIGKKADKLKEISTKARIEIEDLLSKKVYLEIYVKVMQDWRMDIEALKEMGYSSDERNKD